MIGEYATHPVCLWPKPRINRSCFRLDAKSGANIISSPMLSIPSKIANIKCTSSRLASDLEGPHVDVVIPSCESYSTPAHLFGANRIRLSSSPGGNALHRQATINFDFRQLRFSRRVPLDIITCGRSVGHQCWLMRRLPPASTNTHPYVLYLPVIPFSQASQY